MNSTPDDPPRTVTQLQPPRDGTTPQFEPPSETVAATPEQQKHSAELSTKKNTDLIADRYLLGEEIGRGGMGVVHYAKDTHLNREVAVKLLLDRYPADSVVAARFVEEARITAQLQHPGVAPVHDLGTLSNGRPFLAMKLIKGKTLSKLLANSEDLTPQPPSLRGKGESDFSPFPRREGGGGVRFLDTFAEICQTVAFAHSKGVIHRDLKPANVMVGAFGEVQVMDWGLAKVIRNLEFGMRNEEGKAVEQNEPRSMIASDRTPDSETLAGSVMGTPAYMPPEQAKGEIANTTARSDVFALGAILCELLTGDPPYTGSFEEIRAHSILGDIQPALARLNANAADPDLIALATACLTPDPAGRPSDAGEVVTRLTTFRTGVADRLKRAEQDKAAAEVRVLEQIKRRRVWLALAALMVIGSATSIVFAVKASFAEQFAKGETLRANIETDKFKEQYQETQKAHVETQKQKTRAEKQLTRAEWLVYANHIDDALRLWDEGRAALAEGELDECRFDLRGWEHDYAFTRFCDDRAQVGDHREGVRDVAFSPDGMHLVTASWDGTVKVRTFATGRVEPVVNYRDAALCLSNRLGGTDWVAGFHDGNVRVWDSESGRTHFEVRPVERPVWCARFSPDGTLIAIGTGDNRVLLLDARTGQTVGTLVGHTKEIRGLAFSLDGRTLVSGSWDGTARGWDIPTRSSRWISPKRQSLVQSVDAASDGTRVAWCHSDGTVCVANVRDGSIETTIPFGFISANVVRFHPDGSRIAIGGGNGIEERVIESGLVLARHPVAFDFNTVAYSPDGRYLAGASSRPIAVVYRSTSGLSDRVRGGFDFGVTGVSVDRHAPTFLTSTYGGQIGRHELSGPNDSVVRTNLPRVPPLPRPPFDKSENPHSVAVVEAVERLVDTADTRTFTNIHGHPDGTRFLTSSWDRTVRIWDRNRVVPLTTLTGHAGWVNDARYSPDGTRIASASSDGTIRVWDAGQDKLLYTLRGHGSQVECVDFSHDGRFLASGSIDNTARIWDAETGQLRRELRGHTSTVKGIAFDSASDHLATASNDGTARIWDINTGKCLAVLKGHRGDVKRILFLPRAKRIVTASSDKSVWLWESTTYESVAALNGHKGAVLDIDRDVTERFLVSAGNDKTVRIWDSLLSKHTTTIGETGMFVIRLSFDATGKIVYARDKDNIKSAWLTATGQPAPDDEPIPDFEGKTEVFSPDGKFSARIVNGKVQLRDEAKWARFDAEMKRRLKEWSQPNPAWHLKRADECAKDKNDFAERFHLRWVVKQVPTDFASALRLAAVEARIAASKTP